MTAPEGGFYSALDAETTAGEGAYYVWSRDQVKEVLGEGADGDVFSQVYGMKREPNFEGGRYVLLQPRPIEEQAEKLQDDAAGAGGAAEAAPREHACRPREAAGPAPRREDPHRLERPDDRRLCRRLPGVQERGLPAGGGEVRRVRPQDAPRSRRDACSGPTARARPSFPPTWKTTRSWSTGCFGSTPPPASSRWLGQARTLADRMIADFADSRDGGFFFTAGDHESLLARPKDPYDGALPGANSMAALDLLALHRATGRSAIPRCGAEDDSSRSRLRLLRIQPPCRSC